MHHNDSRTSEACAADPAVDLTTCTFGELSYFLAGVLHGTLTKAERDAETEARHAAALHSRARSIVHAMASVPTHDELEARRRDYSGRRSA